MIFLKDKARPRDPDSDEHQLSSHGCCSQRGALSPKVRIGSWTSCRLRGLSLRALAEVVLLLSEDIPKALKACQTHLGELPPWQTFKATRADTSLYSKQRDSLQFVMARVHDLVIAGHEDEVNTTIQQLEQHLKMGEPQMIISAQRRLSKDGGNDHHKDRERL